MKKLILLVIIIVTLTISVSACRCSKGQSRGGPSVTNSFTSEESSSTNSKNSSYETNSMTISASAVKPSSHFGRSSNAWETPQIPF